MEYRLNADGTIEVEYNGKWFLLTSLNWWFIREHISLQLIVNICHGVEEDFFKKEAFQELKRRMHMDFNLSELWAFFLYGERLIGDMALKEIFERSANKYALPADRNR